MHAEVTAFVDIVGANIATKSKRINSCMFIKPTKFTWIIKITKLTLKKEEENYQTLTQPPTLIKITATATVQYDLGNA